MLTKAYLNRLIAEYKARSPSLTWPEPLAWRSWPERAEWLIADVPSGVPSGVGTVGAYELGRCVFKRAGLDYEVIEDRGRAVAIIVGPKR